MGMAAYDIAFREQKDMAQPTTVEPGQKIRLADFDPAERSGFKGKREAKEKTAENVAALADLGYRLYAEQRRSLLIVLQGTDTAGKDGVLRHVIRGFNPQSCQVTSFRQPTEEELAHDFLWRVHKATPRHGYVGVFNRSHYEDVLIVRVHRLVPKEVWSPRYDRINEFEQNLIDAGTTIVKCFLHISKDEQRERLQARLDNPDKRWKFSQADLVERQRWDEYQHIYEDALTKCNTKHAPWHIIPADRKWHRDWLISHILRETLERMDPKFPPEPPELAGIVVK
jgi:PPK2 family polyphosphate:nucleotide phosphotransferase